MIISAGLTLYTNFMGREKLTPLLDRVIFIDGEIIKVKNTLDQRRLFIYLQGCSNVERRGSSNVAM